MNRKPISKGLMGIRCCMGTGCTWIRHRGQSVGPSSLGQASALKSMMLQVVDFIYKLKKKRDFQDSKKCLLTLRGGRKK